MEGLAHRGRDGVVLAAVRQQRGHAEREPRGGRGRGVALGLLLRRAAQQPPHDAVREPPLPRALEVEHAGLRTTTPVTCTLGPVARGGERGEVAAGGVADRDHAREVERRLQHAQVVDRRADVVERGRPAAAAQPPSRRYSRFHAAQPRATRSRHSGCISLRPYCAFQKPPWRTTATGNGPSPGREEQLAELRALVAVAVVLADQAATPSERAASARRVTPSSICSGVTPE